MIFGKIACNLKILKNVACDLKLKIFISKVQNIPSMLYFENKKTLHGKKKIFMRNFRKSIKSSKYSKCIAF